MDTLVESIRVSTLLSRAWYSASISEFLSTDSTTIFGQLGNTSEFGLLLTQRDAWLAQIAFLQEHLAQLGGTVFLEFNIPRMGRRIDAVLIIGPVIFVIEFKVGESSFDRAALDQVWDYALDLKNFHEGSHSASIVPLLIATEATGSPEPILRRDRDKTYHPIRVHPAGFRKAIDIALQIISDPVIDQHRWSNSPYRPTPTIVEAARALYAKHSVESIARFDAGAKNLRITSSRIEELIDEARVQKRKLICFVTGVPGAGKTLVGLNVATRRGDENKPTHAVFLSGNGPLVAVLREALARDEIERKAAHRVRVRKGKFARA